MAFRNEVLRYIYRKKKNYNEFENLFSSSYLFIFVRKKDEIRVLKYSNSMRSVTGSYTYWQIGYRASYLTAMVGYMTVL